MTENKTRFLIWLGKENNGVQHLLKQEINPFKKKLRTTQLDYLFSKLDLHSWVDELIQILNRFEDISCESKEDTSNESKEQIQAALNYIENLNFAAFVNSISFYKKNPWKLFTAITPPEKLISVQMRLCLLHDSIQYLQSHLYDLAKKNCLCRGVDYFIGDDELPQGIQFKENEHFRTILIAAIKKLKVNSYSSPKTSEIDYLYRLFAAYKFSFKPCSFIDAAMVLQQNLLPGNSNWNPFSLRSLQEKILTLFAQLPTKDCLNLYGFFSNEDTHRLINIFFTLAQGRTVNGFPTMNTEEKDAIKYVFHILSCIMESLRIDLEQRHLLGEPYRYHVLSPDIEIGVDYREAVNRAMTLYQFTPQPDNKNLDLIFQSLEINESRK